MTKKDGVLILKDEKGIEKKYIILASFRYNSKYFVIYTDYKRDEEKNIKVWASIYNSDDKKSKIEKIKDKKDKDFIEKYVKKLEQDLKLKMKLE